MKVITINKHSSKLKIKSVEMPNAPNTNRYMQYLNFPHFLINRNICKHTIILVSILILSSSYVVPQKSQTNLKVMTYNIWNGFDWGKDTTRKENWIKWIHDIDPDVLALQELCGYNEEKLKADAAKWGHNYAKILKTEGYPVGLTSKRPIIIKERVIDGLWHGMLHCETYGIDFFVVHLSPADCEIRLKEAKIITEKVKQCKSDKFIILGDFNAHSPFDGEALKHNQSLLKKYSNSNSNKHSNLRLGEFDYSTVSTFIALPSIDVSHNFIDIAERYSFPTPALIGVWQTADQVKLNKERIDYILTSPIISKSCTNAVINHNNETNTFSDHYPVMAEFKFEIIN
ncbi:MAG: endonuclease/exonuclease/phosphatase family protein [Bacteroidota bacterium]